MLWVCVGIDFFFFFQAEDGIRDGHVTGVQTCALPICRAELIDKQNIRCRWQNHCDTGECRFDCFDPVIDLSPAYERVARSRALLELVGQLYGERACLFKDKLIFKLPGADGYRLHQDYIAWESFPTSFVTVIVAIDPCDHENGAT